MTRSFRYSKKREPLGSFLTISQQEQINFILTDNVRILCLSCNVKKKVKKQLPKYLKIAETRVVLYDINGALCEVRAYSATVSYRRST
jgi:ribosomal protein L30E